MDPFARLLRALGQRETQYVVIGVWGANYYAHAGGVVFPTRDRDILLPLDPDNLLKAWEGAEEAGLSLWIGDEPLDMPRDRWLAERVVERRMVVRATDGQGF